MLRNSENFNTSNFPQYQNGIYPQYNNYIFQNTYNQNTFNNCGCCFVSKKDFRNSKGYYILTERINNTFYKRLIKDSSIYNSYKFFKDYKYPPYTQNTIDSINISSTIPKYTKIGQSNSIYNLSRINTHESNIDEIKKNNRKILYRINSNESNNTQYLNTNNSTSIDTKRNNCKTINRRINNQKNQNILSNVHNQSKSNILNNEYFSKSHHNNKIQSYINEKGNNYNNHNQTYKNNHLNETIKQRNEININELSYFNKTTGNKDINQKNYSKIVGVNNKNIIPKKKITFCKTGNDKNTSVQIKKKIMTIKMQNMKKSNKIILSPKLGDINPIKKISLINNSTLNELKLVNNNNHHSFYERKSLSKENHCQNNSQINYSVINPKKYKNIFCINEYKSKNKETIIKFKDNLNKKIDILQKNKLNESSEGKNETKTTLDNKFSNELDLTGIKAIKDNKNINNMNKITKRQTIKGINSPMIIYTNLEENKDCENINTNNIKENLNETNNSKKNFISTKPSSDNNIKEKDKVAIKKCKINTLSFLQISNKCQIKYNHEKKKVKKKFSKKNIIQLNNINNKLYEEDIIIKDNKNTNNHLRPQISVRLTLFPNRNNEIEKYFFVNFFYSENIKNKPDYDESDF